MRRALSILLTLFVASLMVLPAVLAKPGGGGAPGGAAARSERPVDLSSRAAINRYLTSLGVSPADAVVQRAGRNYAGPNCPGKGWNCTTETRAVVQLSSDDDDDDDGGDNIFVCHPAGAGTDPATNTCVIVQANTTGTNRAFCIEHDEQAEGTVEQSCQITQTNSSGQNIAFVGQSVAMEHDDTTQRSEQRSEIVQINGKGSNRAEVGQVIVLATEEDGPHSAAVVQTQDAIQDSYIEQTNGLCAPPVCGPTTTVGSNRADLFQSHSLKAEAEDVASAEQLQNAEDPFGETNCNFSPNTCSSIQQSSTNGSLLINLKQVLRHRAEADDVEDVFQQQGSSEFSGGMEAINHQNSTGVARRFMFQDERQTAIADDTTQLQFTGQGPRLNSDQVSNLDNVAVGNQIALQFATDPTFQQLKIEAIAAPISGDAQFTQRGCQNTTCEQQTVSGGPPGVFAEIGCHQGVPPDSEGSPPPEGCVESGGSTGEID
jgi:hypothetical protein